MNLALKDIQHNLGRFTITTLGIGMLLAIVMGMGGIYRGLVEEATLLVDKVQADFWVVQESTRGPFAEISRLPRNFEDRLLAVPGVMRANGFITHNIQREFRGHPLRLAIQGLSWPEDKGGWLPIASGRSLGSAHYEMVADAASKLSIGDRIPLGKNTFEVVGLTRRMSSNSGDPMAFMTISDAQSVQFDLSPESIRAERAARIKRFNTSDFGRIQPLASERAEGYSSGIPALGTSMVSAVLVHLKPGADPQAVKDKIEAWPDASVYSHEEQRQLLVMGMIDKARRQLLLFRILLIIVSGIIMALIIYTLTLDKLHDIAMLKIIGARNSVIFSMILQQSLLLGALGFCLAYVLGQWLFEYFPRRVVITEDDLLQLAAIVLVVSIASSLLGIAKAFSVESNEVLS